MAHEFAILTPEKTLVSYRLAGIGSRILAHILDLLLIVGIIFGILFLASFATAFSGGSPVFLAFGVVFLTFLPFLYFILLEGLWNGQTLGKKAAGVRVRMADGTPITFWAATGRNLIRVADLMPGFYFAGLLAMFLNPRSQRLGDLVSSTIVIHDRKPEPIFTPAPYVLGVHRFEDHVGDLRGMSVEEYVALKKMCDRFPELSRTVQERLIRDVWNPIASRRGIKGVPNVHPIYLAEATVMKYGRSHGLM